jgi:hypothetical protein
LTTVLAGLRPGRKVKVAFQGTDGGRSAVEVTLGQLAA